MSPRRRRSAGWTTSEGPAGTRPPSPCSRASSTMHGDGWRHVLLAHWAAPSTRAPPTRRLPAPSAGQRGTAASATTARARTIPCSTTCGRPGRVTGELHAALASDPAEPCRSPRSPSPPRTRGRWESGIAAALDRAAGEHHHRSRRLRGGTRAPTLYPSRGDGTNYDLRRPRSSSSAAGAHKIRCHGDYHLGQVLKTLGRASSVIDFEGEPRPAPWATERRAKQSPAPRRGRDAPLAELRGQSSSRRGRAAGGAARSVGALDLGAGSALPADAFLDGYA